MSQHELLLGELQMYSDSLREWGEKLREEDICSKIMSASENKDDMLKRYNMCKSLNMMEQEFQTQLMKHAGALLKLMNKLHYMVHCSLDLREVIEKESTEPPVKKTETQTDRTPSAPGKIDEHLPGSHFGLTTPAKKPAAEDAPAKKLKKPSKKIKLNTTDCLANDII